MMAWPTLFFAVQTRFHRGQDGSIRTDFGYARYEAWLPYLESVGNVILVARVGDRVRDTGHLVEGPRVSVLELPYYRGPVAFARNLRRISSFLAAELVDPSLIYAARIPNLLAPLVQRHVSALGGTYVVQVVGDVEDVMKSGVAGIVGKLLARASRVVVSRQVSRADGVIYVTRYSLQRKYPAAPGVPTLVRSNVELDDESFAKTPRDYALRPAARPPRLIAVGSQERHYKGHDLLIAAVAGLRERGLDVELTLIGSGRNHETLRALATDLKLTEAVRFLGQLSGPQAVREHIEAADLFVMPSRSEGLPRVLIEAMATGVASIGSRVGGIPELLSDAALFDAGSTKALQESLERVLSDPAELTTLAREQFEEARVIAESFSGTAVLSTFMRALRSKKRRGDD